MKKLPVLAVLISTIFLSGCLKADFGAEVQKDGSGTIELSIQLNEELVDALYTMTQAFGGDNITKEKFLKDLFSESGLPDEETGITKIKEKQLESGVAITYEFDDYRILEQVFVDDELFSSFSISQNGDKWNFEADASPIQKTFSEPQGPLPFDSVMSEGLVPEVNFSLQLPGGVQNSNATTVKGAKAIWELNEDTPLNLKAEWTPEAEKQTANLWVTLLLTVAILALVAVISVAFTRKNKNTQSS